MQLVIVSGLSGSGKSIALQTLEDLDYYCIDNLPIGLLEAFAGLTLRSTSSNYDKIAVGIDARSEWENIQHIPSILENLEETDATIKIIFLAADRPTLLKRFSETRRRHPLTSDAVSLSEAIDLEVKLLAPITSRASRHIDTTHTTIHQLRELVKQSVNKEDASGISLLIQSFGFKHGIPQDADFVYDVRCLPNPHWEPRLRQKTGRDDEVIEFLEASSDAVSMLDDIKTYLNKWIPCFEAENRNYLTIGIGCTGGQHRSVYIAEHLGDFFASTGKAVMIRHRELD